MRVFVVVRYAVEVPEIAQDEDVVGLVFLECLESQVPVPPVMVRPVSIWDEK